MIRILSAALILLAAAVYWFQFGPGAEAAVQPQPQNQEQPSGPSHRMLRCRDVGKGLPDGGEWRGKPLIADLDGDGKPDLAASLRRFEMSKLGDGIHVFLNDGAGNWQACDRGLATDMGYGGIDAGDVNGDGRLDLCYSGHDLPPRLFLNFLHNAEQREWVGIESIKDLPPNSCADVALGDYDGDRHADLAVVGWLPKQGGVYVFHNDGRGEFSNPVELVPSAHYGALLRFHDLDGDGRCELIGATSMGARVWRHSDGKWLDESKGLPVTDGVGQIGGIIRAIDAMDVDGDGSAELVVAGIPDDEHGHPAVRLWKRTADGWAQWGSGLPPAGESFFDAVFARLDDKGTRGLFLAGQPLGQAQLGGVLVVRVARDGACTVLGRVPGTAGVLNVAAGDVDGDGIDEVLVVGQLGLRIVKLDLAAPEKGAPGR